MPLKQRAEPLLLPSVTFKGFFCGFGKFPFSVIATNRLYDMPSFLTTTGRVYGTVGMNQGLLDELSDNVRNMK
ncbi:hypothetical protein [Halalkalibacter urbisdiaboli]|uniref:hypothetical protein n=1 Tax=Halalkalibacter urbisdiaboli TaxID=1960589 RepID=UPI000B43C4F4|nr:hypothetical protein [Halalkalibacter urbisdiaboli]